uniref:Uncharacterized protein n=1 Tax=Arundo donax TaxID=35708 RepID=A0A0A9FVF1_ARUDO
MVAASRPRAQVHRRLCREITIGGQISYWGGGQCQKRPQVGRRRRSLGRRLGRGRARQRNRTEKLEGGIAQLRSWGWQCGCAGRGGMPSGAVA